MRRVPLRAQRARAAARLACRATCTGPYLLDSCAPFHGGRLETLRIITGEEGQREGADC